MSFILLVLKEKVKLTILHKLINNANSIQKIMKTKKNIPEQKLTGEQIVQKKLDEANAMLRKMDFSKLPQRIAKNQG